MALNDNSVIIPDPELDPTCSVLKFHFTGSDWTVSPRALAALFTEIGDLVDAGLPGTKVQNVTFDRNQIVVELR